MRIALALLCLLPAVWGQDLNFSTYRTKVEPVFLKKRPGHARCVVCHTIGNSIFKLVPMDEGAKTWTEEQSRKNFEMASKLVNPKNVLGSPLLKHPLAEKAGGDDFHSGGRQFMTQNDPDWKVLADWARGK
jgi:hypothetical protein